MKKRVLAVVLLLAVLMGIAFLPVIRIERNQLANRTLASAREVVNGCQAYQRKAGAGGRYPAKLSELIEPPFAGGPFVLFPGDRIVDGWGNPFRYALVPNETGEVEPYVWAEREEDGEVTLVGAKGLADGTTVLFGVPK